jgi:hypothetical protein
VLHSIAFTPRSMNSASIPFYALGALLMPMLCFVTARVTDAYCLPRLARVVV